MSFNLPYKFQMSGREVVIQHKHNGHIRVSPNNLGLADGAGGTGQFARWKIHLLGGSHCRLQSIKTGKYLRLWRGGRECDVNGGTGPFTKFKIHYHSRPNGVKLESDRFPGRYIAVNPNRTMKIGSGGHHCNLWIKREGGGIQQPRVVVQPQVRVVQQPRVIQQPVQGVFNAPYMFRQNNTVVIRSNYGKHLRVHPNNQYNADGNGGTGKFARWKVHVEMGGIIKLQNTHTMKYLRIEGSNAVNVGGTGGALTRFRYHIHSSPNGVRLESVKFPGRYIAIRPNGNVMKGQGGVHCRLTFFRQGQAQQKVIIQQQPVQPTVIVQQPLQPVQPQVIVQSPSYQQQQAQLQAQQQAQLQAQQAQLAAQQQAQMQAQQQQMQQQMEQMRLQNEASLQQQRQQMEAEKQQMEQQMAQQQAELAAQQQSVLDSQKVLLEQQQAQLSQSSLINSPKSQNEGISSPVNPYYGNDASNVNTSGGGGGGGGDAAPSYPVLQPVPPPDEKEEPEAVPRQGQEAADEVLAWLQKLKMERYYKTFIENGYDQLETIGEISKEDLKEMGVALGHIKIIVASSLTAPFMNKRVKLKSVSYDTYIHEYGKAKDMGNGGKRCILQHNDKKDKPGAIWVFECVEDQTFRLKHEPSGSWLRLLGADIKKEADTRSPFSDQSTLMLEKGETRGIFYIKNVKNEFYLGCEKPRSLGYNRTKNVQKKDNECRFHLKLVK